MIYVLIGAWSHEGRQGPATAAICALAKAGKMTAKDVARAIKQYKIDAEKPDPALA